MTPPYNPSYNGKGCSVLSEKLRNKYSYFLQLGLSFIWSCPPFYNGMKPDMMLIMMFIAIILIPSLKNVTLLSIVTGILSALTTTFPGG